MTVVWSASQWTASTVQLPTFVPKQLSPAWQSQEVPVAQHPDPGPPREFLPVFVPERLQVPPLELGLQLKGGAYAVRSCARPAVVGAAESGRSPEGLQAAGDRKDVVDAAVAAARAIARHAHERRGRCVRAAATAVARIGPGGRASVELRRVVVDEEDAAAQDYGRRGGDEGQELRAPHRGGSMTSRRRNAACVWLLARRGGARLSARALR